MLIGVSLVSCEKEEADNYEAIKIEIESDGGIYTFSSNTIEILSEPNGFNAKVENNSIVGNYAGSTTAKIKAGNTTYDCEITVKPSYTYFVDMYIYLFTNKSEIEKLYGSPISSSISTYYYNPLSSYLPETKVAFAYDDDGSVLMCGSYFTTSQSSYITKHIQQRYAPLSYSSSYSSILYGDELVEDDCTMYVMLTISSSSILVSYIKASALSKSASAIDNIMQNTFLDIE